VPKLSINIGIVLIILGIVSYIATSAVSVTALIPAFFGLAFGGLGILAKRNESMRKHAMHAALLLAILGLGGSFGGLTTLISSLFSGETPDRLSAVIGQSIMAALCILFLILGVKSFVDARKERA
jgi:hypothetical protein